MERSVFSLACNCVLDVISEAVVFRRWPRYLKLPSSRYWIFGMLLKLPCCIKIETNFVLEWWHVAKNDPLLFWVHWPPVVLLFWWHQQKTEECTSIGCFAKFLLGVWIFSLYNFSDFLEKRFCHRSLSCQFFCHKPFLYTPCYTHNQIFSFGRSWGTFGVPTPLAFWGKSFELSIQQCALCCCHCCKRVVMSVSGFPCTNGRSFLLQSVRHKTAVLFTLSGQFLGWFTLRLSFEAVQRKELFSFCLYLPFPHCLPYFQLSSLLVVPHIPIESAHWKFKLQKMPNCVWVAELFQELSCLYKPISLPHNRSHFFQTCPTASTTWLNVAMIRKV